MRTFLVVSFGTVVAAVTAASFLTVAVGAATEDYVTALAGATLWGMMFGVVFWGWGLYLFVRWVTGASRRRR